jgi:hypothetical protein
MPMNDAAAADERRLRRELRWLKVYAFASLAAIVALAVAVFRLSTPSRELTVGRIDVVDPDGTTRLVIANSARMPPPRLDGKTYKRAVQPAGLVFYDAKGNEVGGLAITDAKMGKVDALAFDYPNYDAIGLLTRIAPDGKDVLAGLQINSHPPADLSIAEAAKAVQQRIRIVNENENAQIVLADPQGRDRIRLGVDAQGKAKIEMLDAQGNVTFSAPDQAKSP